MKALRWHGNRDIRLDDMPEPEVRPGWVKIKNAWAGVCGSDLTEFLVGPRNAPVEPHVSNGDVKVNFEAKWPTSLDPHWREDTDHDWP